MKIPVWLICDKMSVLCSKVYIKHATSASLAPDLLHPPICIECNTILTPSIISPSAKASTIKHNIDLCALRWAGLMWHQSSSSSQPCDRWELCFLKACCLTLPLLSHPHCPLVTKAQVCSCLLQHSLHILNLAFSYLQSHPNLFSTEIKAHVSVLIFILTRCTL